jgi:hypothetical protein
MEVSGRKEDDQPQNQKSPDPEPYDEGKGKVGKKSFPRGFPGTSLWDCLRGRNRRFPGGNRWRRLPDFP